MYVHLTLNVSLCRVVTTTPPINCNFRRLPDRYTLQKDLPAQNFILKSIVTLLAMAHSKGNLRQCDFKQIEEICKCAQVGFPDPITYCICTLVIYCLSTFV